MWTYLGDATEAKDEIFKEIKEKVENFDLIPDNEK